MKEQGTGGVFLPLTRNEMRRLEFAAWSTGGSVERFLLLAVLGAVEQEEAKAKAIQEEEAK